MNFFRMSRSSFVGSAFVTAATVAACSVEATSPLEPTLSPNGSSTVAAPTAPTATNKPTPSTTATNAVPGGEDDGGVDGAAGPFASDPLNCGAMDHSCLGRPCAKGRCALESIEVFGSGTQLGWFGFDELHRLVTVSSSIAALPQTSRVHRRSSTTTNMAFLFNMTAGKPISASRDAAFFGEGLFIIGSSAAGGLGLSRWTSNPSGPTGASTVLDDVGPPWFAIDASYVFFLRNQELIRTDHAGGGRTRLASSTSFPSARGALDGTSVYFLQGNTLSRVPKADGPVQLATFTAVPGTGGHTLVGVSTTHAAVVGDYGPVCSGPSMIWSAPKAGGPSVVLGQAKSIRATVDGDFAYWLEFDCYSTSTRILRRRLDGTDAALVLAEGPYRDQPSLAPVIHEGYVYFAGPTPSTTDDDAQAILRVGK
jgi:hypothetical protein